MVQLCNSALSSVSFSSEDRVCVPFRRAQVLYQLGIFVDDKKKHLKVDYMEQTNKLGTY